jgi:hypothetical protein
VIAPARTESDALAGAMLAYVLRVRGIPCTWFSERILNSEIVSLLTNQTEAIVCVSALTPTGARAAASLFKRIAGIVNGPKLLGLWASERTDAENGKAQPDVETVNSFEAAIRIISATASDEKLKALPAAADAKADE